MATLVLTVIGDDRPGLVSALSGAIADHGGSWDRSEMARLAGKFAGIVLVTVPDDGQDALRAGLEALRAGGLLEVTVEPGSGSVGAGPAGAGATTRLVLDLVGTDRPGIVREISGALASRDVSIEELATGTREAPMAGGVLFEARATVVAPASLPIADLRAVLEALAGELMVDIALSER